MSGVSATKIIDAIIEIEELNTKIDNLVENQKLALDIDLLQSIPGVAKYSAESIIAEIGNDMEQFPSEKHLASWAGMAPGNNESGGKKKLQRQLMETNI